MVRNFFNCGTEEALGIVSDLMTARMREFQYIVAVQLPAMFDDFDLSEEARATLTGYAEELEHWLSGILTWHQGCRRYAEVDLLRHNAPPAAAWGVPTGLGTSAARITTPFRPPTAMAVAGG